MVYPAARAVRLATKMAITPGKDRSTKRDARTAAASETPTAAARLWFKATSKSGSTPKGSMAAGKGAASSSTFSSRRCRINSVRTRLGEEALRDPARGGRSRNTARKPAMKIMVNRMKGASRWLAAITSRR